MNQNIGSSLLACLVLLLLILSLGVPRWPCQGYIFGKGCTQFRFHKVVGILWAAATVAALPVAIFLLLVILRGSSRMFIAAIITTGITVLLAMTGTFYDTYANYPWCQTVAKFGSGIALGLFVALLIDYFS